MLITSPGLVPRSPYGMPGTCGRLQPLYKQLTCQWPSGLVSGEEWHSGGSGGDVCSESHHPWFINARTTCETGSSRQTGWEEMYTVLSHT